MTQHRDIERVLDDWLAEGSTVAPDRVVDDVADRIERERQRPAWRASGRERTMTTNLRIAAAVAAIAILGAGAVYLTGRSSPLGVGGDRTQPTPSGISSFLPGPSPRTISSVTFRPALRLQLPSGWVSTDGDQAFHLSVNASADGPGGSVEFKPDPVVGSDANGCEGLAAPGIGTSIDEILTALSSDPRFTMVSGGTVTLDGRTAHVLDIQLVAGWTGTCNWSASQPAALLLTVADPPGPFLGLIGSERMRLILLDVDGSVVAIAVSPAEVSSYETFVARAMPIIQRVVFRP